MTGKKGLKKRKYRKHKKSEDENLNIEANENQWDEIKNKT